MRSLAGAVYENFAQIPAHDRAVSGSPVCVRRDCSRHRASMRVPAYASTGELELVRVRPRYARNPCICGLSDPLAPVRMHRA